MMQYGDYEALYSSLQHRFNVSRETFELLVAYVDELLRWQKIHNLISQHTISQIWERHIADSLQIISLAPENSLKWIDIGAGAGLPGIVVAIALRDRIAFEMHLIDSHQRKCAFLNAIIHRLKIPVRVHPQRIETVLPQLPFQADVLSARALCSLDELFGFVSLCPLLPQRMLFLKGKRIDIEIKNAEHSWQFNYSLIPSASQSDGCILSILDLKKCN
jgi:16S rRNA (guanine527-N7)-methyltransferase